MKSFSALTIAACTIAMSSWSAPAAAQFAKPADAVKYRQAALTLMASHFGRMQPVLRGQAPYDAEAIQANVKLLSTLSELPWAAFGPGTEGVVRDRRSGLMPLGSRKSGTPFRKTSASYEPRPMPAIWTKSAPHSATWALVANPVTTAIAQRNKSSSALSEDEDLKKFQAPCSVAMRPHRCLAAGGPLAVTKSRMQRLLPATESTAPAPRRSPRSPARAAKASVRPGWTVCQAASQWPARLP